MQVRSFPLLTATRPTHSLPRFAAHEDNPGQTFPLDEDHFTEGQKLQELDRVYDYSQNPNAAKQTEKDYRDSGYKLEKGQQSGTKSSSSTTKPNKK